METATTPIRRRRSGKAAACHAGCPLWRTAAASGRGARWSDSGLGQRGHQHGPQAALAGLAKGIRGGCVPKIGYFAGLNAISFRRFNSASMSAPS
jgi:hypothetical protein